MGSVRGKELGKQFRAVEHMIDGERIIEIGRIK